MLDDGEDHLLFMRSFVRLLFLLLLLIHASMQKRPKRRIYKNKTGKKEKKK